MALDAHAVFRAGHPLRRGDDVLAGALQEPGGNPTDIALYPCWLYLPWVIKPLWSARVDLFGPERRWIGVLPFSHGVAFALVGLMLPGTVAGWIQDHIGYVYFFLWMLVCTLPTFVTTAAVFRRVSPEFGNQAS